MKTIALVNNKGGVGKTMSAISMDGRRNRTLNIRRNNPRRSMKSEIKYMLFVSVFLSAICTSTLLAQSPAASSSDELTKLRDAVEQLKAENYQLKSENQLLRKMLTQQAAPQQPAIPTEDTRSVQPSKQAATETQVKSNDQQETGYWMTISSGKRHNKNCRYYKNSKGRFCKPDEGVACKICGG